MHNDDDIMMLGVVEQAEAPPPPQEDEGPQPQPAAALPAHLNPNFVDNDSDDDDEECRVCRGPAEEGHPLFRPCKCSGSIALVHQDCLKQWLRVQSRADGRCELCKTVFSFAPQYHENAPERLPWPSVAVGLARLCVARYFPFLLRCLFCAALWLLVAPLLTNYLYQAWMHRPGAVWERWMMMQAEENNTTTLDTSVLSSDESAGSTLTLMDTVIESAVMTLSTFFAANKPPFFYVYELLASDLVSGAVVAAFIIVSFLAIMSFADFLRVELQQRGGAGGGGGRNRRNGNNLGPEEPLLNADNANIDNEWFERAQQQQELARRATETRYVAETVRAYEEEEEEDSQEDWEDLPTRNNDDQAADVAEGNEADEPEDDDEEEEEDDAPNEVAPPAGDNNNFGGALDNNNNDGGLLDDDANLDMDINVALDELLGVRGPLHAVVRNLTWLLAFNAVYLGFFTFFPKFVGKTLVTTLTRNSNNKNATAVTVTAALVNGTSTMKQLRKLRTTVSLWEFRILRSLSSAMERGFNWIDAWMTHASYGDFYKVNVSSLSFTESLFDGYLSPSEVPTVSAINVAAEVSTNSTTAFINSSEFNQWNLLHLGRAVEEQSLQLHTTFRLSDLVHVTVGYLAFCAAICAMSYIFKGGRQWLGWAGAVGAVAVVNNDNNNAADARNEVRNALAEAAARVNARNDGEDDEVRDALDEINRIMLGADNQNNNQDLDAQVIPIGYAIGVALDALLAVVKVGVLLLLKMFLLPIGLGICLDVSTLVLFGATLQVRIAYAGSDLFAFLLLHWVAGITFMLLVTVIVLQLREVAHPELLAQVIRPQEPQPDLLGNLLHETVATHAKRMVLSLIIYVVLLCLHVHLPVQLLSHAGILAPSAVMGRFLQIKTCYWLLLPQLQVPLELLFFHLCMLGLLEKNKNSIGEVQHLWLFCMAKQLGLVESVLPMQVVGFELVGSRQVYMPSSGPNPTRICGFWKELANLAPDKREACLLENLYRFDCDGDGEDAAALHLAGQTKPNGERVLSDSSPDMIRLPYEKRRKSQRNKNTYKLKSVLIPTKIGRFRLQRNQPPKEPARGLLAQHLESLNESTSSSSNDAPFSTSLRIQLWVEVAGKPVARPPEGWDDLGAGGAEDQGRWAWGREKKSTIERSIAYRKGFTEADLLEYQQAGGALPRRSKSYIAMKLTILALASWMATLCVMGMFMLGPLSIGRFIYYIFRISDDWIHDPFCFAIGSLLFFPLLRATWSGILKQFRDTDDEQPEPHGFSGWLRNATLVPQRKLEVVIAACVFSLVIAPFLLGWIVDLTFLKTNDWFLQPSPENENSSSPAAALARAMMFDIRTHFLNWLVGILLLGCWARCCIRGLLTRRFWTRILGAAGVAPANENGGNQQQPQQAQQEGDNAHNGEAHQELQQNLPPWQGEDGRVASFFNIVQSIFVEGEWDTVDPVVLLHNCAWPVADGLFRTLFIPLSLSLPLLTLLTSYGWLKSGFSRAAWIRGWMVTSCLFQISLLWKDQLLVWLESAHQAARDDRYLIGEILLNYRE